MLALSGCLAPSDRSTTVMRGRVVDSESHRPVVAAEVSGFRHSDRTGLRGQFRLEVRDSGSHWVRASHLWYRTDSLLIDGSASRPVRLELRLTPLPRPCCELRGYWQLTLWADTAGWRGTITPGPARGWVDFGPRHRDLFPGVTTHYDHPGVPYEPGRFAYGEAAIWPKRAARFDSLRAAWGPTEFDRWRRERQITVGCVYHGDSVTIAMPPESHSGVGLLGRIAGDSIAGIWFEGVSMGPTAEGHFFMHRVRP